MSQEIELKLLIEPQQRENTLNECRTVAQEHGAESSYQALELANAYFDTSDLRLRQYDMGLRIRRSGDQLEQTIKLAAMAASAAAPAAAPGTASAVATSVSE